jgi:hypothetical protein
MENCYRKVSIKTAKESFKNGKMVYLMPSKLRMEDVYQWIIPYAIDNSDSRSFENIVSAFKESNCNHGFGLYVSYYVNLADFPIKVTSH